MTAVCCHQWVIEKCTVPFDRFVTLTTNDAPRATGAEDAGTRRLAFHESEPVPQSCRRPLLVNAARSYDSFPDVFVGVIVPLQRNRSARSFNTRLNFPFLMGVWNPWKDNWVLIT
jgi:hypothetical protein